MIAVAVNNDTVTVGALSVPSTAEAGVSKDIAGCVNGAPPVRDVTVRDVILRDGSPLRLRTPTPKDYDDIKAFYDDLSEDSRYSRFSGYARSELPAHLDAEADGDARVVLTAWRGDRVVACGSYYRLLDPAVAEVAFTVADDLQGRGVATRILQELEGIGAAQGIERFYAQVAASNTAMLTVFDRAGFSIRHAAIGELEATLDVHSTETMREPIEEPIRFSRQRRLVSLTLQTSPAA